MSSHNRVQILEDGKPIGRTMKRNQVRNLIEFCKMAWVEEPFTARTLSLSEQLFAKAEQNRKRAPIASAEIPGIKVTGIVQDFGLIRAANQYAQGAIS